MPPFDGRVRRLSRKGWRNGREHGSQILEKILSLISVFPERALCRESLSLTVGLTIGFGSVAAWNPGGAGAARCRRVTRRSDFWGAGLALGMGQGGAGAGLRAGRRCRRAAAVAPARAAGGAAGEGSFRAGASGVWRAQGRQPSPQHGGVWRRAPVAGARHAAQAGIEWGRGCPGIQASERAARTCGGKGHVPAGRIPGPRLRGAHASRDRRGVAVPRAGQWAAIPPATPTEGHRPVTPVLRSCQTMARPTLGGGVAGPGGTARADSGGLCLRRAAACMHTEEVDPCPPTCTFPSKTMTRS
jgi:hypothetical protein